MGKLTTLRILGLASILSLAPLTATAQSVDDDTIMRIKHELTSSIPVGGVIALEQLRDARNLASETPLTAATRPQPTQQPHPAATIEHL